MKLLVGTTETQGKRKNDFCFVPEGEIVHFTLECDGETIDGPCGCRRSMSGLDCATGTTTTKCVDVPIDEAGLVQKLVDYYVKNWKRTPEEAAEDAKEEAAELMRIGEVFELGTVVEKRGRKLRERLP
jgi:hypothetical protein